MDKTLHEKITRLPSHPGVYQFKDSQGVLLYIGKAKNLKKRVSSYFNKRSVDAKTLELVARIADIEIIVTKTEVEALLLEASFIRKNQPPYNINLKEGSGYAYLKMTDEEFPRLLVARNEEDKAGGKLFGPYPSAQTRREAQYLARTTFKLRTCVKLPKRACLLYHIGLCTAPCIGKISREDYADNVAKAGQFLKGDIKDLRQKLSEEMKQLAGDLKYEQARVRRDQLLAIERLQEKQAVNLPKNYDQDVMASVRTSTETVVQMFNISKGLVGGRQEFHFQHGDFSEFIRRFYENHAIPEEIIIADDLEDRQTLQAYLTALKGKKVTLAVPRQGGKKDLVDLLKKNLAVSAQVGNAVLYELQRALNLPRLPRVIEMFDISHTGGVEIVASLVQFRDGRPDKSNYRKFKMKTVKDNDDFAAMREVVRRRYARILSEGGVTPVMNTGQASPRLQGKINLPDLIIVDGGRGQLSSALHVLRDLGVTTPLLALAKREEEVYTVGLRFPVRLPKTSEALKLLQRIRDEAHRFAITFHRQRRSKRMRGLV